MGSRVIKFSDGTTRSPFNFTNCDGTTISTWKPWEKVDGTNGSTSGDFVSDTPADHPMGVGFSGGGFDFRCDNYFDNCDDLSICDDVLNSKSRKDVNCDKYEPDWNNYMAYRTGCRAHFTSGQGERMRAVIGEYLPEVEIQNDNAVLIFDQDRVLEYQGSMGEIEVKEGVRLEFSNSTVYMADLASIVLKQGAQLILNNSTITACYGERWSGVDAKYHDNYVELNNSEISNAHFGVDLSNSSTSAIDGGRVYMHGNSSIKDCTVGLNIGGGNVANLIVNSTFRDCSLNAIELANCRGTVIENTRFINNDNSIYSSDAFFQLTEGNEIVNGRWAASMRGTYPLGSGVLIGKSDGTANEVRGQSNYGIAGYSNSFPTGAHIVNTHFDDCGDFATGFVGADEYMFMNNTVTNTTSGIAVFAAGNADNRISCNQFTNISNASTIQVWHNEGTLILENHFDGNQNVNMGFAGSAVSDQQGFGGESASNCFSGPSEDIVTQAFIVPNGSFNYAYYGGQAPSCTHEPFNNGTYTKNVSSNIGDFCDGIGVFNLIDPTGGNTNVDVSDIRPESVDPNTNPDLTGPPVQPPYSPEEPPILCIPCLVDSINVSIEDVVEAGGDDPNTTISEGLATQIDPNLPQLEATMNQWISFGLYVSLMTDDFSLGEQILAPLKTWEWRTKYYGFKILQGELNAAQSILTGLDATTQNELQFVNVQQINLKRFRGDHVTQADIDLLHQIAYDINPSRGYARSLYEVLTKTRLPIDVPAFTSRTTPRSLSSVGHTDIYPNPLTDVLTINVDGGNIKEVRVYSQVGKLVKRVPLGSSTCKVDMSEHSAGLYMIQLQLADGTSESHKAVKL